MQYNQRRKKLQILEVIKKMQQKNILAVHDISCIGRCSLTVALPVISAAGITASILPTAVLSTHTGGFEGYTYRDLTEDMLPIADHWQTLNTRFDAIYTGYLGSHKQLKIIEELINRFNTLVIVDPVMADFGRLYSGFTADFPQGMLKLCQQADVVTPNITEALLMLGEPYKEGPYTREYICGILEALVRLIKSKIVLTGVYLNESEYGAAAYNNGKIYFALGEHFPGQYHGTGDLFASVLSSALVSGNSLNQATDAAVKFTAESIKRTYQSGADLKYGVNFEAGLFGLKKLLMNQ